MSEHFRSLLWLTLSVSLGAKAPAFAAFNCSQCNLAICWWKYCFRFAAECNELFSFKLKTESHRKAEPFLSSSFCVRPLNGTKHSTQSRLSRCNATTKTNTPAHLCDRWIKRPIALSTFCSRERPLPASSSSSLGDARKRAICAPVRSGSHLLCLRRRCSFIKNGDEEGRATSSSPPLTLTSFGGVDVALESEEKGSKGEALCSRALCLRRADSPVWFSFALLY